MILRDAANTLKRLEKAFPILVITGPRQAGKTTLARNLFASKPYVSLESPDEREFAETDPRRFLARFPDGAILDEIQRVPSLLSWLQGWVDDRQRMGDFILTGSAQFPLMAAVSQSLAGRVGRVELLPLSVSELRADKSLPDSLDLHLLRGSYPAIHDRNIEPGDWFSNYIATYVERDVRQWLAIRDLTLFQRFLRLCAARSGQIINLAALGNDCGISAVTAREWLTVLETSYIAARVPPYFRNYGKRLVKSPKLYFLDSGLMAWLLGIRDAMTLSLHPLRGAIFETMVFSELAKQRLNAGQPIDIFFWRDNKGEEVDFITEWNGTPAAIEVKAGSTWVPEWAKGLRRFRELAKTESAGTLIYGGDLSAERDSASLRAWRDV